MPKGGVKTGELNIEAGAREAFEEAGIEGEVFNLFPLTVIIENEKDKEIMNFPVTFYPMKVTKVLDYWPEKHDRERRWI